MSDKYLFTGSLPSRNRQKIKNMCGSPRTHPMAPIRNVYIFVADALRWDYLPEAVSSQGSVLKTVAASTLSPTSFASITSGLYPPQHGVWTFSHRISERQNWLLEADEFSTAFWQSDRDDPIYRTLDQDPETSRRVDEMNPPFVNLERELATHAPYGLTKDEEAANDSAMEFLNDESRSLAGLREAYRDGANRAVSIFEERLDALADQGLLDETLVIFTSDHGELLGEYGSLSHVYPVVPELVYVPTVVLHPDGKSPVQSNAFSHVDIPSTVSDVLNVELPYETPGTSAFKETERQNAYSGFSFPAGYSSFGPSEWRLDQYESSVHSLWDSDGGWVFDDSPFRGRLQTALKNLLPMNARKRHVFRQNLGGIAGLVGHLTGRTNQFGEPGFNRDEARRIVDELEERAHPASRQQQLGDDQLDRLENLGYLE